MRPLRSTILHPQWLVFRAESGSRQWVLGEARGRVLDIGCADGWARELLRQCDYVGLDYPTTARGMYGTVPDVFADGASLPFANDSFDTVLLLEVLEHVRQADSVLREIVRVLKPGGRLLLSMPFLYPLHDAPHDYRRYTAPGLHKAVSDVGLCAGEVRPLASGLEAPALLAAIGCAEAIVEATRQKRWRLIFAPFLIAAIPLANATGWVLARMSGRSKMLAAGYALVAIKPE